MRDSQNNRGRSRPKDTAPASGQLDPGAQPGLDGGTRPLDALESALTVVLERVGRLEDDVRHLQSQNVNRS